MLIHFTSKSSKEAILKTGKIGSRWGIYAIAESLRPKSRWGLRYATLVQDCDPAGDLRICGEALDAFRQPVPIGIFSFSRRWAGVYSTALGSVDIRAKRFEPDEIIARSLNDGGWRFRAATTWEKNRARLHRFGIDFGIDLLIYGGAALAAFLIFYVIPRYVAACVAHLPGMTWVLSA